MDYQQTYEYTQAYLHLLKLNQVVKALTYHNRSVSMCTLSYGCDFFEMSGFFYNSFQKLMKASVFLGALHVTLPDSFELDY